MKSVTLVALLFGCVGTVRANAPDPEKLARRIDAWLARSHKVKQVQPAPRADDAEFLRRASLDLIGRIPIISEVREFLADKEPTKRRRLIETLLDDPRHAVHFANLWREMLTPETTADGQGRFFKIGFEGWLRQQFRQRVRYDKVVRDLLTTPIASDPNAAEVVFRDAEKPNALAFYAVKDARPENLAAAVSRLFLGVQLECAQCHNHPFANWTKKQFWNQAAFFAGVERQGKGLFAPLTENLAMRELQLPNSSRTAKAMFLDGNMPQFRAGVSPRVALAEWITAPDNPFFARATVNRLWGLLFGVGIVDPVDNYHDENRPSHPELLDELARAFVDADYDVNLIITAICLSEAYQRTSAASHASQDDPSHFARMTIRAMTGEQFFDSLIIATAYQEPDSQRKGKGPLAPRDQFVIQFAPQGRLSDPETSIQQALLLMNGKFLSDVTDLRKSPMLTAVTQTPFLKLSDQIEMLYLAVLSRCPTQRNSTE